jgi:hypothetical protein
MEKIIHIATSFNGARVAFAEFEKKVQIVDIVKNIIISEFETVLDYGGTRLAISENGNICVCGCWERYGICGYEVKSGKKIWQRKDLKKVQGMQLMRSNGNSLFAYFEDKASQIIDINNGETITKIVGGIKGYYENKFVPITLLDSTRNIKLIDRNSNKALNNIKRQSFATLDICFSKNSTLISECGEPLRCYNINDGELLWVSQKIEGEHFLNVAYNEKMQKYIGVAWPYEKGGNKKLKYINCNNGEIEKEITINCPVEAEFGFDGNVLITSDKEIIEVQTGKKRGVYANV